MARRNLLAALACLALLGADTPKQSEEHAALSGERAIEGLDLEARRQALETLERELEKTIVDLEKLRRKAETSLSAKQQKRTEELSLLVKFYSAMKPDKAARLLEELPVELAADVMSSMKARPAGKVMNVIEPGRAVQISRRMAGGR